MASVASANFSPIVSRNSLARTVHDAVRLYVGRGRRYSVKQVSNGSGVPDRVIEAAMADPEGGDFRMPAPEYLFSLMAFLRADFANEVLPLAHLAAFDLPDEDAPPPGVIVADAADSTSDVAQAAADGKFCPNDKARLRIVGQRDIERGLTLVGLSKPARKAKAA